MSLLTTTQLTKRFGGVLAVNELELSVAAGEICALGIGRSFQNIRHKIQGVNAQGTTILLIEQNANLALSVSHYATLLSVGSIVMQGTPQAIKDEGQLMNAYLGGTH